MSEKERIAIITDSSCDLPKKYLEENEVYSLPLHIIYKDGELRDGIDITTEEVYESFAREIPTTSMPNPGDLHEILAKIREQGIKKVLFVLISKGLSGTVNMVNVVCADQTDLEYEIVDTRILTWGEGFLVQEAVEMRKRGVRLGEYNNKLQKVRNNVHGFFCVPTLEYLVKGGRIGLVSGIVGNLLHLKPVIGVNDDGVYYTAAIARGYKKAVAKMRDIIEEKSRGHKFDLFIIHGAAKEECKKLMEQMAALPGLLSIGMGCVSPALSVHVGQGLLGIVLKIKD